MIILILLLAGFGVLILKLCVVAAGVAIISEGNKKQDFDAEEGKRLGRAAMNAWFAEQHKQYPNNTLMNEMWTKYINEEKK